MFESAYRARTASDPLPSRTGAACETPKQELINKMMRKAGLGETLKKNEGRERETRAEKKRAEEEKNVSAAKKREKRLPEECVQ